MGPTVAIIGNSPLLGRYFKRFLEAEGAWSETLALWCGKRISRHYDAYILTGDFSNITDGLKGYHRREIELLERTRGRRTYASCFAHQLVAEMHGGKVERRASRLLGWERIAVVESHPALEGIQEMGSLCMNTDEVAAPPPGARLLGTSENCRYQILAYGDHILSCQAHPELASAGNRLPVDAAALFLSRSARAYRAFRDSLTLADDDTDMDFMKGVTRWLLG